MASQPRAVDETILLLYKVVKGMCSENIKLRFKPFNGRENDFLLLNTPNFKTKYGKRIFEFNGSRLWNALPCKMRMEEDVGTFKKDLKTLLFDGTDNLKKHAFQYQ